MNINPILNPEPSPPIFDAHKLTADKLTADKLTAHKLIAPVSSANGAFQFIDPATGEAVDINLPPLTVHADGSVTINRKTGKS